MERTDYRFSRRDVRQYTGWSDPQIKRHLHKLEELEYLIVHRGERGQSFVYELYFERPADPRQLFLPGFSEIGKLREYDENRDGQKDEKDGPDMPQVRPVFGDGASTPEPITAGLRNGFHANPPQHIDTSEGMHARASTVIVAAGGLS